MEPSGGGWLSDLFGHLSWILLLIGLELWLFEDRPYWGFACITAGVLNAYAVHRRSSIRRLLASSRRRFIWGTVGAFIALGMVGAILMYPPHPTVKQVSLFAQCHMLPWPSTVPPGNVLYELQLWSIPAASGGGGLSESSLSSGQELKWPKGKNGFPATRYRCELTNDGSEPMMNVKVSLHQVFQEVIDDPLRPGQRNGGRIVNEREWPFIVRRIDAGAAKPFVFDVVSYIDLFAEVTIANTATAEHIGDATQQTVAVRMSPLDVMRFTPFR